MKEDGSSVERERPLLKPPFGARLRPHPFNDEPPELPSDAVAVLEGSTFLVTNGAGDVPSGSVAGLFHEDTRLLSTYVLTVDGQPLRPLSVAQNDHHVASLFVTNAGSPSIGPHLLSVRRDRRMAHGFREEVQIRSHAHEPLRFVVSLEFAADFADLFEVKDAKIAREGAVGVRVTDAGRLVVVSYANGRFDAMTAVAFDRPARVEGTTASFDVEVPPRGLWGVRIVIRWWEDPLPALAVHEDGPLQETEREAERSLRRWRDRAPSLRAGWEPLERIYGRSVADVAALRLHLEVADGECEVPAAGMPWFMALFGRDPLLTSYEMLLVAPQLARGTLVTLGALQGERVEDFRDEQPGKMMHELRFGRLTALGRKPHSPYFGTVDATPLWLILLSELWRLSRDDALVRSLWSNATRALNWIDRYGDLDGDGYVEYATRSPQGLANQGWKDSWNAIQFADGRQAGPPIALCEVQGYVFDAKMRTAELAERVAGDERLAERLRREAGELRERFNDDFWLDERGGFYALALDHAKRPVDSLTSNVGHLLWSGIVPSDRARALADRLCSDELFSGWGVRTMSTAEAGFNPVGYHTGTVWPHDNALVAEGLARYGFRAEAGRIACGILEAAEHLGSRLPEVFAGYARADTEVPVRFPTASSPQAWASAAPIHLLRVMLGVAVGEDGIDVDPAVPPSLGRIRWEGVRAGSRRFDVTAAGREGTCEPDVAS